MVLYFPNNRHKIFYRKICNETLKNLIHLGECLIQLKKVIVMYLQWCLRLPSQNSVLHPIHLDTAWSGTHNVGAGPGSSKFSHDKSEGTESPGSAALSAESGKEPYN